MLLTMDDKTRMRLLEFENVLKDNAELTTRCRELTLEVVGLRERLEIVKSYYVYKKDEDALQLFLSEEQRLAEALKNVFVAPEDAVTTARAVELTKVPLSTLRSWVAKKKIPTPGKDPAGLFYWTPKDIDEVLDYKESLYPER